MSPLVKIINKMRMKFLKFFSFYERFLSIISNQFHEESLYYSTSTRDNVVHLVVMHCTIGTGSEHEHRKRKREKERHRYETSLWCEVVVATSQQRRRRRRVRGSPCL